MSKNKTEKNTSKDLTPALEKFGLLPEYPLTKKEKKILAYIGEAPADFLTLCKALDIKPSKLEEKMQKLITDGFVTQAENGEYRLTSLALQYRAREKEDKKREKKFKKFLLSLDETETEAFFRLCDRFQYVEDTEGARTEEED